MLKFPRTPCTIVHVTELAHAQVKNLGKRKMSASRFTHHIILDRHQLILITTFDLIDGGIIFDHLTLGNIDLQAKLTRRKNCDSVLSVCAPHNNSHINQKNCSQLLSYFALVQVWTTKNPQDT